jgi:hypothetical protein
MKKTFKSRGLIFDSVPIRVFIYLIAALLSNLVVSFASEGEIGAFAFINAVDSEKPTFLSVNGEVYKLRGYKTGQVTTAGRLYVGPTKFTVENEELGTASLSAPVSAGEPVIIVAYVERIEREDGKVDSRLKLTRVASRPTNRMTFSAFIVSSRLDPVTLLVDSKPVVLEPQKLIELSSKGSITVSIPGTQEGGFSASPESAAHFIVLGYEKKDGSIATILFEDNPSLE